MKWFWRLVDSEKCPLWSNIAHYALFDAGACFWLKEGLTAWNLFWIGVMAFNMIREAYWIIRKIRQQRSGRLYDQHND